MSMQIFKPIGNLIDDSAGYQDKIHTWSADKLLSVESELLDADIELSDKLHEYILDNSNPINIPSFTSGKYIYVPSGTVQSSANWSISGFLPINGDLLYFTCPHSENTTQLNNIASVAFYKSPNNSDFISSEKIKYGDTSTYEWLLVKIPKLANYIRITVFTTNTATYKIYIAKTTSEKIYYVSKNNICGMTGEAPDSQSITKLFYQLKDNKDNKIIYIEGGNYDIFQEYADLRSLGYIPDVPQTSGYNPSSDFWPYNVYVPTNTHVIGCGNVILSYAPASNATNANESKTISPINMAGSATLENISITAKNCRYAIHDDSLQYAEYNGAIKKYINVSVIKEINDTGLGYIHCFGSGLSKESIVIFKNCYLRNKETSGSPRTLYFHDRITVGGETVTDEMSAHIIIDSSVIYADTNTYAVALGNIPKTSPLNIHVDILNSYIRGAIIAGDEGAFGNGNNPNSYNIKTVFSKYVNIIIRNSANIYTPENFNY